ncbi:hypothetical protein [Campylobacter troglodytis]|uniref:hypothetical protein n=1 Tax=Campylobacter troglodytis TaxID=654363 RepID=UPI00163B6775|nr:hypothetical protein [Campylobacter troglodytis]
MPTAQNDNSITHPQIPSAREGDLPCEFSLTRQGDLKCRHLASGFLCHPPHGRDFK